MVPAFSDHCSYPALRLYGETRFSLDALLVRSAARLGRCLSETGDGAGTPNALALRGSPLLKQERVKGSYFRLYNETFTFITTF